jgi:hypothetical protein
LDEESFFPLPCSYASDENFVFCLSKESVEIEFFLEVDVLCSHGSKEPRYEKPYFDSYDDDEILLPRLNIERQHVFDNKEKFSHAGKKIPLGISFKNPPLFDHCGDIDKDVEVFIEEKGMSIQPSDESEIFYQEKHDKDKYPSIDIHEAISCHQLVDVIRAEKGEADRQPASTFHSPVLSMDIQPDVSSCKAEKVFIYRPGNLCHLFYDPIGE